MIENVLEKGLSYYSKKFGKRSKTHYYSSDEVNEKIAKFGIKRFAVLVDESTTFSEFDRIKNASTSGYYSFSLDAIGTLISGKEVQPLLPGNPPRDIDGWLMSAGNIFANYSLNQYLFENGCENQIIVKHVNAVDGTKYYSYIDFFSNEQKTMVQIHNYFKRCYEIPFPIDLQLTLRDSHGMVLESKQVIIPPNGTKVITSDDFSSKGFAGYLEVEFDVTSKVNRFLHYYATYMSDDFISNNHQSGLGLHPAQSAFTRGFIPENSNETLVVCLFQKNYTTPVVAKAILRYYDGKTVKTMEREFPPLKKHGMLFQDIKELFRDVDFSKTLSPIVDVISEVPLHRPNYYYAKKGKKGYYDISHAGPDPKVYVREYGSPALESQEREKVQKYGCSEMELKQFILPEATGIESMFGFAGDSTCPITDFRLDFYDEQGELASFFEHSFNFEKKRFINLNKFLKDRGINNFSGTVSLRPSAKASEIPMTFNGISGYRHIKSLYLTSTASSGGNPDNIPFYFVAGPPNYLNGDCSVGVTEIYGPAICSDIFDTYFCITYPSANKNLRNKIEYEIQVYNTKGNSKVFYRTINSHGTDFFRLSDLLSRDPLLSEKGSYVLWFFSVGAHLYGQRILMRKSDNAISVEHCYPGKYGI